MKSRFILIIGMLSAVVFFWLALSKALAAYPLLDLNRVLFMAMVMTVLIATTGVIFAPVRLWIALQIDEVNRAIWVRDRKTSRLLSRLVISALLLLPALLLVSALTFLLVFSNGYLDTSSTATRYTVVVSVERGSGKQSIVVQSWRNPAATEDVVIAPIDAEELLSPGVPVRVFTKRGWWNFEWVFGVRQAK